MKFNFFGLFFFLLVLYGCGLKSDATQGEVLPEIAFSSNEVSTLVLPVSIDLRAIERKVNAIVPWEFKNPEWPGFMPAACNEPKIKYALKRDSLHFKVEGNTLYFDVYLKYGIEGEMCPACWGESCASPMVPFSCGVGKESPRVMHWVGKIIWTIGGNLQLKTKSESLQLTPMSPCEFTWFKLDFTRLVVNQMQGAIQSSFAQVDQALSKRNLQQDIAPLLQQMYSGFPIQDQGVLSISPKKLAIWNLKSNQGRLEGTLGVETELKLLDKSPEGSGSSVPSFSHQPLPDKKSVIRFQLDYSMEAIQRICKQHLIGRKWPIGEQAEEYLWIHDCTIQGKPNGLLQVELIADIHTKQLNRKNVKVNFSARPVLERNGMAIRLSDPVVDFSAKNQLLEWGFKWESWKSRFQDENIFLLSLVPALDKAKMSINDKFQKETWKDITVNGSLDELRISKLYCTENNIQLTVEATGQWALIWNKSF